MRQQTFFKPEGPDVPKLVEAGTLFVVSHSGGKGLVVRVRGVVMRFLTI